MRVRKRLVVALSIWERGKTFSEHLFITGTGNFKTKVSGMQVGMRFKRFGRHCFIERKYVEKWKLYVYVSAQNVSLKEKLKATVQVAITLCASLLCSHMVLEPNFLSCVMISSLAHLANWMVQLVLVDSPHTERNGLEWASQRSLFRRSLQGNYLL